MLVGRVLHLMGKSAYITYLRRRGVLILWAIDHVIEHCRHNTPPKYGCRCLCLATSDSRFIDSFYREQQIRSEGQNVSLPRQWRGQVIYPCIVFVVISSEMRQPTSIANCSHDRTCIPATNAYCLSQQDLSVANNVHCFSQQDFQERPSIYTSGHNMI